MRRHAAWMLVGAALGLGWVAVRAEPGPGIPVPVVVAAPTPPVVPAPAAPAESPVPDPLPPVPAPPSVPPAAEVREPVARRIACSRAPERIGRKRARLPTGGATARTWWRVAAAAKACVIVVWSEHELRASFDDGASFAALLAGDAPIVGADVRADGAIVVMREDFTLTIAYPDGRTVVRTLAFLGKPSFRGRWLVMQSPHTGAPAISDDDGAHWRHLDWGDDGWMVDLRVLADGTIVVVTDHAGSMCDHFGCGGPTRWYEESHLDGRPWQRASREHVRAARMPLAAEWVSTARAAAVPPEARTLTRWSALDSHRLIVTRADDGSVMRYTRAGWRVLVAEEP
jgi:hypothetical protein